MAASVTWLTELHLRYTDSDWGYQLLQPLSVVVESHLYEAPTGMPTDGASIPRFFYRLTGGPFSGRYVRAAVIHDAACLAVLSGFDKDYKEAARLFLILMEADGVPGWKRRAMHQAVLRFGPRWPAKTEEVEDAPPRG